MANEELRKVGFSPADLDGVNPELVSKMQSLEAFAERMEKKAASLEAELTSVRASEERLRGQLADASHRERVLVHRLSHKDHETNDIMAQIVELKSNQTPGVPALRSALLDPAVNLVVARLRAEVISHKTRLEDTQSELSAWKFTPDSNTGKRLMAKCRLLYQENEDLGRVVSSGRIAKLEGDLALQKQFSEEVKKSQSELDELLQDLDEDVEGMQGTICFLQQELRKAQERTENEKNVVSNGISEINDGEERTFNNVNQSEHSVAKRPRRSSELSLDYNEDEFALTNGDREDS